MVTAIAWAMATFGVGVPDSTACQDRKAIRLQIVRAVAITDELLDTTLAETVAIWARHNVVVCPIPSLSRPDHTEGQHWIKLVIRDVSANRIDGRTPRGRRALASIVLTNRGVPGDTIYASLDSAHHEIGAARFDHFPPEILGRLAARLLGQAIAHELGHYLLQSTRHSRTGLMRGSFGANDLLRSAPDLFRLEPEQAAAVAARLRTTSDTAASSQVRK